MLYCNLGIAQGKKWSVQFAVLPGKLLKHSEKMKFIPSGYSKFMELDLAYQTQGKKRWERYYHYPRIGFGFRYLDFGAPVNVLGKGVSFYPYLDLGFFQRANFSGRFIIACGLAYLDHPFHIKNNPLQTAIGSKWNNLTNFQLRFEHKFLQNKLLYTGVSLSHISNGAYQAPNLGLNFLSVILGLAFDSHRPVDDFRSGKIVKEDFSRNLTKFSFSIETGLTLKEIRIPGGPKYLISWYMLDAGYQYNDFKSWRLSLDIEKNHLASYFSDYTELRPNKKSASKDGLRLNAYLAHQWLFGNIGLTIRTGYQFLRKISLDDYPVVTKLDLSYIVPYSIKNTIKPYVGVSLKTHFGTAEYIGLMAGLRIHNEKRMQAMSQNLF